MKTQGAGQFRADATAVAEIQGFRRQGIQEAEGRDQDGLFRPSGPRGRQRDDQPRHAPREHRGQSRPHAHPARTEAARRISPGDRAPLLPRVRPTLRARRPWRGRVGHPPLLALPRGLWQAAASRRAVPGASGRGSQYCRRPTWPRPRPPVLTGCRSSSSSIGPIARWAEVPCSHSISEGTSSHTAVGVGLCQARSNAALRSRSSHFAFDA